MQNNFYLIKQNWQAAWNKKAYRVSLISGLLLVAALSVFTYHFFYYIEHLPGGTTLNDWVLKKIPAKDVSLPITLLEASVILIFLTRSTTDPNLFVTCLIAFIFILILRIITIYITQLRPPAGLIELKDPIAGMIYKSTFITRDLFYSGHISILYLFYLSSRKKPDRYYILFAVVTVAVLLLIQHVHYTIDVVCAPFFSFTCFWLAKRVIHFTGAHLH